MNKPSKSWKWGDKRWMRCHVISARYIRPSTLRKIVMSSNSCHKKHDIESNMPHQRKIIGKASVTSFFSLLEPRAQVAKANPDKNQIDQQLLCALRCQRNAKRDRCSILPAEDAVVAHWCSASAPSDPGCSSQSIHRKPPSRLH